MVREDRRDVRGLRAPHLLVVVQGLVFLVLVVGGEERTWFAAALETFGVTDLAGLLRRPWSLFTYPLVNVHPLPFALSAGVLLLVGAPLEDSLGRRGFVALYAGTAALGGVFHVALHAFGVVEPAFVGATCASAGLLTAYLFVRGSGQPATGVPFPIVYVLAACFLFMLLALVRSSEAERAQRRVAELAGLAYGQQARTSADRRGDLLAIGRVEGTRADLLGHLVGLLAGGVALGGAASALRAHDRYRMRQQIRGLQEEVDARARVEELLAKISGEGMDSLTRHERKFLRYASRFYRSGRHPVSGPQ